MKIAVINKIKRVLGINKASTRPQPENLNPTAGRCFKCVEAIVGMKSYKAEREKLNNNLKTKCSKCQTFISKKHQTEQQFICEDCIE